MDISPARRTGRSVAGSAREPVRSRLPLLVGIATIVLLALLAARLAGSVVERGIRADQAPRVEALSAGIESQVDRLRHLTVAMAAHPDVRDLLAGDSDPPDASRLDRVNRYLAELARASGASLLYALDTDGLTLGASNHADPDSLVGNAYRFRPYFREALRGHETGYFAIGATTAVAGYYYARPVLAGTRTLGVVVVKIELESLQRRWEDGGESLLLIDEHGVTIAASRTRWRYRDTRGLSSAQIERFRAQRKYAGAPLAPLGPIALDAPDTAAAARTRRIVLDGRRWSPSASALPDQGWTIVQLAPLAPARTAALVVGAAVLLVGASSTVGLLYARERRRRRVLARSADEARRMRRLNARLQDEIHERRQAETARDEAQANLIQASKLSVLGQMSAAVAHEVNQPLSAIRTYAASARLLLQRDRPAEAVGNLDQIEELTERLAVMTGELKVFARRPDGGDHTVDLVDCARRTVQRFALQEPAVSFTGPDAPAAGVPVRGNAVRLEQVLGNLLANAVDATTANAGARLVDLSIERDGPEWVLRVADNGEGLDERALEHLFDPFFTTKPVGQGVGLGLAIAYGIVQEMSGRLRVRNLEDGGALFSLRLAAISPQTSRAQAPETSRAQA